MTQHPTTDGPGDDLTALPEVYAAALRLARVGTSPARIADDLGIPVESVAGLLVLAEAKLTAANRGRADPGTNRAEHAEHTDRAGQPNRS